MHAWIESSLRLNAKVKDRNDSLYPHKHGSAQFRLQTQGEYTTVYHAVQNMESKDRPKRQALSRDAGRDMNADGEAACENNDVGYVNEVNGSTKVMGVRKRTTLGVC